MSKVNETKDRMDEELNKDESVVDFIRSHSTIFTILIMGVVSVLCVFLGTFISTFVENHEKELNENKVLNTVYDMSNKIDDDEKPFVVKECTDFTVDRVCTDGKHIYYLLTDTNGNTLTTKTAPTVSDKNYVNFWLYTKGWGFYDKGDVVVNKFTINLETAKQMGATNDDIALSPTSNDDGSYMNGFTTGYILKSILDD